MVATSMLPNGSDDANIDRKEFIAQGFRWVMGKLIHQVENSMAPLKRRKFLRPPGAQVEPLFLALCTRCDACTAACPHEVISVQYGEGPPHDGTPILFDLESHPCLLCEDTPCISACPTEALLPVADVKEIRIGTAVLDTLECTAFRGSGCQTCYEVCPYPDEAIEIREGLPFVLADACTGCGLCQSACPVEPTAIAVFPAFPTGG